MSLAYSLSHFWIDYQTIFRGKGVDTYHSTSFSMGLEDHGVGKGLLALSALEVTLCVDLGVVLLQQLVGGEVFGLLRFYKWDIKGILQKFWMRL